MEEHAEKKLVWSDLLSMDFDSPTLHWQDFRKGVDMLPLHGDPTQGCSCALLRYQPGAHIPRHLHVGMEFLLILRGSQRDERGQYHAGTFLINPATSSHEIFSEEGCVVLAVWEKPVKFISAAD
ncbi:cupin domain-containing protein [Cellvibrio sp.]